MKNTNKIIITAKEWFDKINGNSYFAVKIELENETLFIPFSYGYGDSYYYATMKLLSKENYLPEKCTAWEFRSYCKDNNTVLSYSIQRNCLKRELKELVIL